MKLINSLIRVNIVVVQIVEKVLNEVSLFASILGGAGLLARIGEPTRVFDSSSSAGRSKPQFRVSAIAGAASRIAPVIILADFIYSIHII
jgi:hypothetical protein